MVLASLAGLTAGAGATSVSTVAGYDYYDGAQGQIAQGVLGGLVLGIAGSQVLIAGTRYDDNLSGQGTSATAGLGVRIFPAMALRIQGTRFLGDETYRAWRARIGPQFNLPGGRSLLIGYSHYEDNQGAASNGAGLESEAPLAAGLTGKLNGSYAVVSGGVHGVQGALGLGWKLKPYLELSGELGWVQDGAAMAASRGPSSRPPLLPILGGGGSPTQSPQSERGFSQTVLVGMRVSIP